MITIDVFLIRDDDGSFLADAHHDYNVGLFGIGQTADEALEYGLIDKVIYKR